MTATDTPTASTALTTSASVKPIQVIKAGLEKMRPQFQATLPSHIRPERFERVVLTAINNNPDLLDADRHSLFNACTRAANDGLLPDGREGALVIFKDRSGKKLVQWMPMVAGLLKLIRQSGEVDNVDARLVFQNELDEQSPVDPTRKRFVYYVSEGQEKLFHDPILWGERGEKVLVYAYARFKTGHVIYAPLHRKDIEKRRNVSRSKDSSGSPWNTWEDEMWLKTALRFIAKRLPLSSEIMEKIERDETPTEFDRMRQSAIAQLGAATTEPSPTALVDSVGVPHETTLTRAKSVFANAANRKELDEVYALVCDEVNNDDELRDLTRLYDARLEELK